MPPPPLPTTEIVILPLKPDASIEDPDSEAGKVWKSVIKTLLAQEGAQRLHWGRQVESPNLVEMFMDWDTLSSHQKFAASPAFEPFLDDIRPLLERFPDPTYHAHHSPSSPASVLDQTPSGIIEHLIFYFEPSLAEADRARWEGVYGKFIAVLAEHAVGFKAVTAGWVVEEVQWEGNAATAFLATLGWDSVEIHLAYRNTKEFQESIVPIREGCKARAVHHVTFQEA